MLQLEFKQCFAGNVFFLSVGDELHGGARASAYSGLDCSPLAPTGDCADDGSRGRSTPDSAGALLSTPLSRQIVGGGIHRNDIAVNACAGQFQGRLGAPEIFPADFALASLP